MNRRLSRWLLFAIVLTIATGCGDLTDAATRLASDIEVGVDQLGSQTGARSSIRHETPSKPGRCTGPYTVQLDKVGALIIWCKNSAGETVDSHSTSYHSRYVDTPKPGYWTSPPVRP